MPGKIIYVIFSSSIVTKFWDFNLFSLFNYNLLVLIMLSGLLLGLANVSSYFKTNVYVLYLIGLCSYIVITPGILFGVLLFLVTISVMNTRKKKQSWTQY